jgi:hypothetical protein
MKLEVLISKTSYGGKDYMQIMSDDNTQINIVLIADEIKIKDARPKKTKPKSAGGEDEKGKS